MKLFFVITALLSLANAAVLTIKPGESIQAALDLAQPGDTIKLEDGDFFEDLLSVRDGEEDKRITITGSRNAILHGTGNEPRLFEVNHSYITLDGFTIDGKTGSGEKETDYQDKLLYVMGNRETRVIKRYGTEFRSSLDGLIVSNMKLVNGSGECLRLRYFVTSAKIFGNEIENCGVGDFVFGNMKAKNGEVIYVGTSSSQISDGKNPTDELDQTRYIHIHHNVFQSFGNECDVKESSTHVLIEHNQCSTQKDPNSACLDSRTDLVVFRYNQIFNNDGAAVRIGGHTVDGKIWGLNNEVYGNIMHDNKEGALKLQTGAKEHPHLCENECKGGCKVSGSASQGNEDIEKKCGAVMEIFWVDENKDVPVAQSPRSIDGADAADGEPDDPEKAKAEPEFEATVEDKSAPEESGKCYPVEIKDVKASSQQGKNTVHAAIDGKSLTRWSAVGKQEWLEIDFADKTKVNGIEISFFKGDERTQSFDVSVDGKTVLKEQSSSGKTLAMQRFPFKEVDGSAIKITGGGNSENDWNSLTEIIVCGVEETDSKKDSNDGDDTTSKPLCDKVEKLKISKVGASADDGKNKADSVLDGDLKTMWSMPGPEEQDISLELEEPMTVTEIGLAVPGGDKTKAFFDVIVETEDHGWEEVIRDGESLKGKGIESYDLGMKGVKTVKIVCYGMEDFDDQKQIEINSFTEIELYGC